MFNAWPLIFVSFASGIALGCYKGWYLFLLLVVIGLPASYANRENRYKIVWALIILCAGMIYYQLLVLDMPSVLTQKKDAELSGKVVNFPHYDNEKTTFILKCEKSLPLQRKVRVVCLFNPNIGRGDEIRLRGELKIPHKPGNPGEFDYQAYLAGQGIYYTLTVKKNSELSLIASQSGLLKYIDSFRSQGEQVTRQLLSQEESSILLGMLLGSREDIDEEQYEDFQKTGIVHLFSVSGLHVGFVLLMVAWLTSLAGASKSKRFLIGVAVLLLYGTMVGWPVPVIRSVIMGCLGLLAYYTGRENALLNALAISGLIILFMNPASLFDLSFQLTFLATWGLVSLFPLLRDKLPYKGWGYDLILIPIAAELAVLPLIAYHFNLFTPVSILANILVTYLSGGAVMLGFISLLAAPVSHSLAALLLYPAGFCVELILYVVEGVKQLPGAYLWVASPALALMILYYSALLMVVLAMQNIRYRRFYLPALLSMLIFIGSLLIPAGYYNRGSLEMVFIDVGQGDSTLIKTPQGRFVLVDGGGSPMYDVGSKTVLPYLHYRGISKLDMVINTHPDIDHLQGLVRVAHATQIKYIGLPECIKDRNEYYNLRNIAIFQNIPIVSLQAGQYIKLEENLEIKVIYPSGENYSGDNFNRKSLVLQIKFRDFSAILCGDIPQEVLTQVLEATDSPVTLVKVPHHGSKGSLLPSFYNDLQPRYAVISVGANNPFGHPHPDVLEILAKTGAKVLRTDQDGAVIVRTNGRKLMINCAKTQKH
ncbi:MAG: DNA internalization-related competence protein ComEC/Rec2 [Syntrophomonas sp.]|nr:DNA internalization-related competence protein ComEC/Rec2 [Syntrophomonas sp.]